MRIAIHQPNFFPWLPFFRKMEAADGFIFLTDCQYEKGGYQSRFRLRDRWYSMPVDRKSGPLIRQKRYSDAAAGWAAIKRELPSHAARLARYDECVSGPAMADDLSLINVRLARALATDLGIKTPTVLDAPTGLTGTGRLVWLCKRAGATIYLSGPSGQKYLDLALFERAGISVEFFEAREEDRRHVLDVL